MIFAWDPCVRGYIRDEAFLHWGSFHSFHLSGHFHTDWYLYGDGVCVWWRAFWLHSKARQAEGRGTFLFQPSWPCCTIFHFRMPAGSFNRSSPGSTTVTDTMWFTGELVCKSFHDLNRHQHSGIWNPRIFCSTQTSMSRLLTLASPTWCRYSWTLFTRPLQLVHPKNRNLCWLCADIIEINTYMAANM